MNLLTVSNAKTVKGEKKGYLTGILYLKPQLSGGFSNVCPKASQGCVASCLNTAGRGRFDRIQNGRQRKTDLYFNEMEKFFDVLQDDIRKLKVKAKNKGYVPCVRVNGTSDLPSMARKMAKQNPDVIFYDYTKLPNPQKRVLPNYYLTFSRSENNWSDCVTALENGVNVSAVFLVDKENPLPKTYKGYTVIDGDNLNGDLRFLDGIDENGKGFIIGLKAKGQAIYDLSGFVIMTDLQKEKVIKKIAKKSK